MLYISAEQCVQERLAYVLVHGNTPEKKGHTTRSPGNAAHSRLPSSPDTSESEEDIIFADDIDADSEDEAAHAALNR